jgi:hypothetical protein
MPAIIGVLKMPGAIVLTRMPNCANSRSSTDNHAALALFVGFVLLHENGCLLRHDERTEQIDPDDALEVLCGPGPLASQRAAGRRNTRAIDRERDAAHEIVRGLHRGSHSFFAGYVGLDEHRTFSEFARGRRALVGIDVEQDRVAAALDNALRGCESESGRAARDDGFGCR